jgi:dTDP-4-dehydrorhamnose 3,5-epimerase
MRFVRTGIPGVIVVEPRVHRDERGFFLETYHAAKYRDGGIDANFVQDNHSRSARGTLRGLHMQVAFSQGKLARCIAGEIFDVAVDVRRGSPTFGAGVGETLSVENFRQLAPPGSSGFCVTSLTAELVYKCTGSPPRGRARRDLERPGDRDPLAGRRAAPVGQGRRPAPVARHRSSAAGLPELAPTH